MIEINPLSLIIPAPGSMVRWTTAYAQPDGQIVIYVPKASNPQGGFPYDIKRWIPKIGLQEWSTENDLIPWNDPAAASACKSYDIAIYFLPDTYNPADGEVVLSQGLHLPWRRWAACAVVDSHDLGPWKTTFVGPLSDRNFGGVIGQVPYFVTKYWYNGSDPNWNTRENFYWVPPFGWVGWELMKMQSGAWAVVNSSFHNTIIPNIVPYDPCGYGFKRFF